ncbi:MAG TPA: nitrilase-related carbon-nitrogen hydrolase, partial [Candidatus Saccharibacteria bacterium]|nr:nitrilase-related carbon-nitrogen hydrolase [Candidatus Saccharibacteria bacterium]
MLDVCGIDYNIAEIQKSVVQALNRGSSIVVFPELSVTGYSVADLFRSATVLSAARDAVVTLAGWS